MKKNPLIGTTIKEGDFIFPEDEDCLKHLKNISMELNTGSYNYGIVFEFFKNEYFENETLVVRLKVDSTFRVFGNIFRRHQMEGRQVSSIQASEKDPNQQEDARKTDHREKGAASFFLPYLPRPFGEG
jgi:hypothetical protein